ncbi:Gfo/Idh/MocA family oxidoreductase [uncultured Paludibaculum sp.]|uniref:Gfo/Idh/MocA family protein n=1 Tax=uncultured Paludibaculum sp. TaxID=1765020 RepID=UPI002AABCFD7|nr:Gfo/Idh/MocA family oxidoreductase [uncultured Paludibaculum sp.]
MNRRHFLMSAAAAAPLSASALASPNDTIRVACVGLRGQGNSHIRAYEGMKNVEIAALCDIDESVLDKRLGEVATATGKKPARFVDLRKVLEDKSIDAISIATPNHNHTLQTIWALQAGKHVYVEKPASHNIYESKQIVAATKKYGKIVQHGVNARSTEGLREAAQQIKDGLIGDVYMARGLCYKWRDTIGRAKPEAVPAGVNYDLWLGPAPKREFTKNRFHYNWHWFWDTGNGDFGNQGIHEVDICRWLLGVKLPTKVHAMGGHFMFDDDQETPNVLTATYEFNEGGKTKMMVFEVRHWMSNHEAGIGEGGKRKDSNTVGNVFYGSKGYMAIDGYASYRTYLGREAEPGPAKSAGGSNWVNFIEAVRANDYSKLNGPIEEGAMSATLMHLANISYRLGRSLTLDPVKCEVKGDAEANAMFTRNYRKGFEVPKIA